MFGEKGGIGKLEPLGTKKIGDREVWGQRRSGTKEAEESRGGIGKLGEPLGTKKFGDKEDRGQRSLGTKTFRDKGGRGEQGNLWGQRSLGTKEAGESWGTSGDKEVRGQRRKVEPPFQSCRHSRRHSRWQFTNKIIESVTN